MSMTILRFKYDDASMYVLTPVPPYSCAHTKVCIKKFFFFFWSISCLHLYQVTHDTLYMHMLVACICVKIEMCTQVHGCMYVHCSCVYMCAYVRSMCVYLYVDEGIFQMSVCEQNTFTAHCMHFFKFTYNPTILYQEYIR